MQENIGLGSRKNGRRVLVGLVSLTALTLTLGAGQPAAADPRPEGTHHFRNGGNGLCLDVSGVAEHSTVVTNNCRKDAATQKWRFRADGRLYNLKSGLCMEGLPLVASRLARCTEPTTEWRWDAEKSGFRSWGYAVVWNDEPGSPVWEGGYSTYAKWTPFNPPVR
ncbi:RICIN domain-containing protein [Streptomyces sp. VNUA116]|uniref:RICIN domain-containing protein n=1 Tax=Streptomyces sp. VNUA116 TaxID=3062449 RepID=UPI00267441C0|nr:RICIN domain-containing protein [Streptomyces sp. VNUA116]WKU42586.1 RICIN domain-containing protein [Streptomyces sp. VNUA116]